MKRSDIFDYIQKNSPAGIQFVDPYLSDVPLPKGDFVSLNILPVEDVAASQHRTTAYAAEAGTVSVTYSQERIYTVQFDCFGADALDTALMLKQRLKDFFYDTPDTLFNLKTVTDIENLSDLLDNKRYLERYSFRMSFYIMDEWTDENQPALEQVATAAVDIAK